MNINPNPDPSEKDNATSKNNDNHENGSEVSGTTDVPGISYADKYDKETIQKVQNLSNDIEEYMFQSNEYKRTNSGRCEFAHYLPAPSELEMFPKLLESVRELVRFRVSDALLTDPESGVNRLNRYFERRLNRDIKKAHNAEERASIKQKYDHFLSSLSDIKENIDYLKKYEHKEFEEAVGIVDTNVPTVDDTVTQDKFRTFEKQYKDDPNKIRSMTEEELYSLMKSCRVMTYDRYFSEKYGDTYTEDGFDIFKIDNERLFTPLSNKSSKSPYNRIVASLQDELRTLLPLVLVNESDNGELKAVPLPYFKNTKFEASNKKQKEYVHTEEIEKKFHFSSAFMGEPAEYGKDYYGCIGKDIMREDEHLEKKHIGSKYKVPENDLEIICHMGAEKKHHITGNFMYGVVICITKSPGFSDEIAPTEKLLNDKSNTVTATFYYMGKKIASTHDFSVKSINNSLNGILEGNMTLLKDETRTLTMIIDEIESQTKKVHKTHPQEKK